MLMLDSSELEGAVAIVWHKEHCGQQEAICPHETHQFHGESAVLFGRPIISELTYKVQFVCLSHALTFWFICFCRIHWWLRYHLSAIRELPALFRSTSMSAMEREREASTRFSPIFLLMVIKFVPCYLLVRIRDNNGCLERYMALIIL